MMVYSLKLLPLDLTKITFPSLSKHKSLSIRYLFVTEVHTISQTPNLLLGYEVIQRRKTCPRTACRPLRNDVVPVWEMHGRLHSIQKELELQLNAKSSRFHSEGPRSHFLLPWPKRNPLPFSAHPLSSGLGDERPWWSSEIAEPFLTSSLAA